MASPPAAAADNFTDNDYFPPLSPSLEAIRPRLLIDDVEEDSLSCMSDTDEELDLNSPWVPTLRSTSRDKTRKRRHGPDNGDEVKIARWRPSRKDGVLVYMMNPALGWVVAGEVQSTGLPRVELAAAHELDLAGFEAQVAQATATVRTARNARIRKRLALPIIFEGEKGPVTVMACPDTGSDDNIVSLELAKRLQLQLKLDEEDKKFSLANGKIVKSLGEASLRCSFGAGNATDMAILECTVYIFESLVVPAIMGAAFLKETETFTKHRNRFVEQIVPSMQALRVSSVGKPKRGLVCRLDTFVGCANADTGSDLDLVNPQFAKQRGFDIRAGLEQLEFADGSIGYTSGFMKASFAVGNVDAAKGFVPRGAALDLEFFVLDSLTSDILIGQDTLEELNVLNKHSDSFIDSLPQPGQSDCNIIRHIGAVESAIKSTIKSMKNMFASRTDQNTPESSYATDGGSEREQLLAVQRENAQREAVRSPYAGGYQCAFAGCAAPPFQTQYLLNSHANIHSSHQPHYCPVKGCPRGEGGKGFKRKNEAIRHGLVHERPGYVCPYCPDREHKYPRPDNLQRHVRVHHVDKDKDDPQLHEVLSQRPDGPSRGRRRRRGLLS